MDSNKVINYRLLSDTRFDFLAFGLFFCLPFDLSFSLLGRNIHDYVNALPHAGLFDKLTGDHSALY